jgi:hypothetical protein
MYVHAHWAYNYPYAARTWTMRDWRGYLEALTRIGYDHVMLWPMLDTMPAELTVSDRQYLQLVRDVIDFAHRRFGLKFFIVACANTVGNAESARYAFRTRPYFLCEQKINPGDPGQVARFLAARRRQFEPIANADALVVIDSDPGGYIGSTNAEFASLVQGQIEIFRKFNPTAELFYWMLFGWERYCQFWEETQKWKVGDPRPSLTEHMSAEKFVETLEYIRNLVAEPWGVLASFPAHLEASATENLTAKRLFFPYGTIEGEPTFPLTNCSPRRCREALVPYRTMKFPRGVMGNAQTHCLQLPNTYFFARTAQGDGVESSTLAEFADHIVPGAGEEIAAAWEVLEGADCDRQEQLAERILACIGHATRRGPLSGFLFDDADRFLLDLASNLRIRRQLLIPKQAGDPKLLLRALLLHLCPYQERLGFVDAYYGPLYDGLNNYLRQLSDPQLNCVLAKFDDWQHPQARNGVVPDLLDALGTYCSK